MAPVSMTAATSPSRRVDFTDAWTGGVAAAHRPLRLPGRALRREDVDDGGRALRAAATAPAAAGRAAYIGEPKFVSAVNGGGYRRRDVPNTANEIAQNSRAPTAPASGPARARPKSTGHATATTGFRASSTTACSTRARRQLRISGAAPCLNTVMLAYPVDADEPTPGREPADWEGAPFGLDAWANLSASQEQANSKDSPFGGAQWGCHGG